MKMHSLLGFISKKHLASPYFPLSSIFLYFSRTLKKKY